MKRLLDLRRFRIIVILLITALSLSAPISDAAPVAQVTPSGDGIELVFRQDNGATAKEVIPLRKSGSVRYFSAGVGVEERQAPYPPFPLKIILIAGDRAYVTHVAITIVDTTGSIRLDVPVEHVTGPWLFVDLPPGTYTIRATRDGQTKIKENVKVRTNSPTTVYLRWQAGS